MQSRSVCSGGRLLPVLSDPGAAFTSSPLWPAFVVRITGQRAIGEIRTNCLENLVISTGVRFKEKTWIESAECIDSIFKATLPGDLLTWKPCKPKQPEDGKFFAATKIKCVVQLN